MKITLPVGYSGEMYRQNARARDLRPFKGCRLFDFEIEDCSSKDVHLIAEWHQNWRFASDPVVVEQYKASSSWLDDFKASASLARLIVVDGKFFSPLRQKENPSAATFVKPILATELHYQMLGRGSRQTILGENLDSLFTEYERVVRDANGWDGVRAREVLPPDGFALEQNDFEKQLARVRQLVSSMLFVDGMLWHAIPEPSLVVTNQPTGCRLRLERAYRKTDRDMFFSLNEYDLAVDFMRANWKPKSITQTISDVTVFKPGALAPSTDLEEVRRGIKQFFEEAGKLLPVVSRETADVWYDIRDAVAASRGRMSSHVVASACLLIERFIHAAKSDGVKIDRSGLATLEFGKRLIDRWEMRPVTSTRSVARR